MGYGEHWKNFLFGLFFGMGFSIAGAVLAFIVFILSRGTGTDFRLVPPEPHRGDKAPNAVKSLAQSNAAVNLAPAYHHELYPLERGHL